MRKPAVGGVAEVAQPWGRCWRSPWRAIILCILGALAGLPASARASTIRHDRSDSLYLNLAAQYPASGLVRKSGTLGSGTLIAPDWVLTAKHVSAPLGEWQTFTINGHTYSADTSSYHRHPDVGDVYMDYALFQLTQSVPGIEPAWLYHPSFGSLLGREGTLVGYGRTGTGLTGDIEPSGTKRACQNMIDVYVREPYTFRSDFDNPLNPGDSSMGSSVPLDLEGSVAPGDSGGGVYVDINGRSFVAGVTASYWWRDGTGDADYGDGGGFMNVGSIFDWAVGYVPNMYQPPILNPDSYGANEDELLRVYSYEGVLANDYDPNPGDEFDASLVSGPSHGSLALYPNGWFEYTPDPDYNGIDSFTYDSTDGIYPSHSTTVTLNIAPVNDPPVALEDFYSIDVDEDDVLNVYAYNGVLSNDTDVDGDELDAVLASDVLHGTLWLYSNGSFTYTPEAGFSGQETFQYEAFDGEAYADPMMVTIDVLAPLQIPGDANGDGKVNADDASIVADHWGESDATWAMGDFDGDQVVGPNDAIIMASNWGYDAGEAGGGGAAVPEPSSLGLLFSMVVGGLYFFPGRSR